MKPNTNKPTSNIDHTVYEEMADLMFAAMAITEKAFGHGMASRTPRIVAALIMAGAELATARTRGGSA